MIQELFVILRSSIPFILPISIFFTGIFLADRERYVHGFRQADLQFFKEVLRLREVDSSADRRTSYYVGKMWLRVSEDFRRVSVYLTFCCVHAILTTALFLASLILALLFSEWYFFIPFVIAIMFALLSLCGHFGRYWIGKNKLRLWWVAYKKISWSISEQFPPLPPPLAPSHLARWKEVGEAIEQDSEFKTYRNSLDEYKDLEIFPDYVKPQERPFFNF